MGDGVRGRTIVVAGATSASGHAAARALVAAGASVIAVGRRDDALAPLRDLGARTAVCDLADEAEVAAFAAMLAADGVRVDGLLHLVGGWRGGGGLRGQTEADYRALESGLSALRHVTRACWDDLNASPAARTAIVSSTAVARPLAGGANYAIAGSRRPRHPSSSASGLSRAWRRRSDRPSSGSGMPTRPRSTTRSSASARRTRLDIRDHPA